jgi:hypothetical protein
MELVAVLYNKHSLNYTRIVKQLFFCNRSARLTHMLDRCVRINPWSFPHSALSQEMLIVGT